MPGRLLQTTDSEATSPSGVPSASKAGNVEEQRESEPVEKEEEQSSKNVVTGKDCDTANVRITSECVVQLSQSGKRDNETSTDTTKDSEFDASGLTTKRVQELLAVFGYNEVTSKQVRCILNRM